MPDSGQTPTLVELKRFPDSNGMLVVAVDGASGFKARRVFTVHSDRGAVRGEHAHIECSQFLVALSGAVKIPIVGRGFSDEFTLDRQSVGLLLPPLTWASQISLVDGCVLMVICDLDYDEGDYVRDLDEFMSLISRRRHSAQ